MAAKRERHRAMICVMIVVGLCCGATLAETVYLDSDTGNDANAGSQDAPVRTMARAAAIVNGSSEPGPTTIKIAPGAYCISAMVVFENAREYAKDKRFLIEAMVLPDEQAWTPALMPVFISTVAGQGSDTEKHAIAMKIEISHATVRGIKFLGNPRPRTWGYSIFRSGKGLDDLVVTQCMFVGDEQALPYNCPICANGQSVVVDHCVFYKCDIPAIFWDAEGGVSKGNAMTHCIVDGADIAAVWTCQTDEDFAFHHNIITRSRYVWMRAPDNRTTYHLRNCVITDNKYASGYGTASSIHGQTGSEVTFDEAYVIKTGQVTLETPIVTADALSVVRPRDYLHVTPGTLGSDLGAGLFAKPLASSSPRSSDSGTSAEDTSKIRDEVWETVRSVNRSWLGNDMEALSSQCHPDVVIVAPGFGRRSEGREASLMSYEGFISMATVKHFKEAEPTIDLFDDTAVVTYRIEIAADVNGLPYAEQGRELHVLKRGDDRWLSIWRMVVPDKE